MDKKTINRLRNIQVAVVELSTKDVAHAELGTVNGFAEAEAAKQMICDSVGSIYDRALEIGDIDETRANAVTGAVVSHLSELISAATEIDILAKSGVHNSNYPSERKALIRKFVAAVEQIKNVIAPLEYEVRFATIANKIPDGALLENIRSEIETEVHKVQTKSAEIQKILDNLQTQTATKSVEISTSGFNGLAQDHFNYEMGWFIALVVAWLALVVAIIFAGFHEFNYDDPRHIAEAILQRILVVSLPVLFMKVCLSKYNTERNLRIVYKHRATVLDQYKLFESAIGDDHAAKNQFRLEIAKYIFSDPQTGYLQSSPSPADINVNPVVSIADKLFKP